MIKFRCSQCQQKIGVADEYAGKRVKCPKCGTVMIVPEAAPAEVLNHTDNSAPNLLFEALNKDAESAPETKHSQETADIKLSEQTKSCPFCGETILEIAKKCKHCGEFINPSSNPHFQSSKSSCSGLAAVDDAFFGRRIVAYLIDGCILYPLLIGAFFLFDATVQVAPDGLVMTIGLILIIRYFITGLYHGILESSGWQASIGKKVFGIIVQDTNGQKLSFLRASARTWAKLISEITLFIGFLIAGTKNQRALHDLIAGCKVRIAKDRTTRIPALAFLLIPAIGLGFVLDFYRPSASSNTDEGRVEQTSITINKANCTELDILKILKDEADNLPRAKEIWADMPVYLKGNVTLIEENKISIDTSDGLVLFCYFNQDVNFKLKSLNFGDKVTVYGRVSNLGYGSFDLTDCDF